MTVSIRDDDTPAICQMLYTSERADVAQMFSGYNASIQHNAEAAAHGETAPADADGAGLMVVGPLMSSVVLRQVSSLSVAPLNLVIVRSE